MSGNRNTRHAMQPAGNGRHALLVWTAGRNIKPAADVVPNQSVAGAAIPPDPALRLARRAERVAIFRETQLSFRIPPGDSPAHPSALISSTRHVELLENPDQINREPGYAFPPKRSSRSVAR